jgi:hypothetical protein
MLAVAVADLQLEELVGLGEVLMELGLLLQQPR